MILVSSAAPKKKETILPGRVARHCNRKTITHCDPEKPRITRTTPGIKLNLKSRGRHSLLLGLKLTDHLEVEFKVDHCSL